MAHERGVVAEFFKYPGGRLEIVSLTVVDNRTAIDGRECVSRTLYDVDWSSRHGYIFHQSGSGGGSRVEVRGIYFATGSMWLVERRAEWCDHRRREQATKAIRKRNRTRRILNLPRQIDLSEGEDLLGWLQRSAIEDHAVHCSECRDFVPGDELCAHTWWCKKICWYSTPSDRCGHEREECEA